MFTNEDKIFLMIIVSALIVAGIIGYFLYSMIRQQRHYRQLQDGYSKAKIVALEKERELIAADLHDDIGPILSATLYKLAEIQPGEQRQMSLLGECADHLNSIYVRIKKLSSMLVPRSIERTGPLYALLEFSDMYKHKSKLQVQIDAITCNGLSGTRSLHLFRMLQEIMHNAIRHSNAKRLYITGQTIDEKLIINTEDDGDGFDLKEKSESKGLGLQNLRTRAEMIGAELETKTCPGEGTKYSITLNLKDDK